MGLLRKLIREIVSQNLRHYFAYGSNMDQSRLHRRSNAGLPCILDTHLNLSTVGTAVLPDYALTFAGHSETWDGPTATLSPSYNDRVLGVLYLTDAQQEAALSCFENADGHRIPVTHDKINITVVCNDGQAYDCYTFVHKEKPGDKAPPEKYIKALQRAYDSRGIEK